MKASVLDRLPREAMECEYVPPDYFRRLDRGELLREARPLEVDLGCGDGRFLIEMAAHYPERDFLGVERLLGRVRKVCRKIARRGLTNAQVLRLESRYVVEWLLPMNAVSRLHLLCPDPWPKLRHHRKRLMNPAFLDAAYRALLPGGEFLFMTDHEEYFQWVCERVEGRHSFEQRPWGEDDFFYPKTDFQLQWEAAGKCMHRLRLVKPSA